MTSCRHQIIAICFLTIITSQYAQADFTSFLDFEDWQSASGPFETITFAEFPHGTLITDQYEDLGVLFTGPVLDDDVIVEFGTGLDGFFLQAQLSDGDIIMEFSEPQFEFGVHFPGGVLIEAFADGEQVYIEDYFGGGFTGIVSDVPFDSIRLANPVAGSISVDNIYFTVPAPGALALFAVAGLVPRGRRRTRIRPA